MPGPCVLPDDGDELGHGELMRHQELGFVQRREILLPLVALDDHLDEGGGAGEKDGGRHLEKISTTTTDLPGSCWGTWSGSPPPPASW